MSTITDTYSMPEEVKRDPIQYTYCVDYDHISRYSNLRQIIRQGQSPERYIALETVNGLGESKNVNKYVVPKNRENRLDLIAQEQLGSATYSWIIAYLNKINDGFTALEGTELIIPVNLTSLFEKGGLLASVSPTKMNLGSE